MIHALHIAMSHIFHRQQGARTRCRHVNAVSHWIQFIVQRAHSKA